ncbi:MAG: recombinase family protein, partial [Paraglaciecola polaris]|uniref:recombinase family protein n=1 Tax=Paraglaciecola polaris TaxID=222814 RepID=UPI003001B52D
MISEKISCNVYLYQRFSSSKQEGNSSLFRQGEAQQEWLARHPNCHVTMLEEQPLVDAGISAFKGKHLATGSLGRLVSAIETGVIPKGSIILVEHFSRLSRMDIEHSEELVKKIWKYGVSLVTARDDKYYPPESINDSQTRVNLIWEIEKAHQDSLWRSQKVKGSWQRREKRAKEEKIPPRMRMPFWLNKEGLLNEYADVVRDIFKLHAEGLGQVLIERSLRKKYGEIKPLINVNPTKIIRIIQNEKCIGKVYGKRLFEAAISDEIFYNAQRISKERLFTSVREDRKWPLHGLVKCGSCGSGMSIQQSANSLPLLRCSRKQRSGGEYCEASTTFPYVIAYHFFLFFVEPVFLAMMSDMKRNDKAEKSKLELHHKIKELNSRFAEANGVYLERKKAGKKAFATLDVMDDIKDEINELSEKLTVVQGKIEINNTMTSISKEIVELSQSDSKEYNLELNKLGFKISLKNHELSFGLDGSDTVATLKYLKYDRKRQAYLYKFWGHENFFKDCEHNGEVRTVDWSIERLLNPRTSFDLSPGRIASMFHE